MKFLIYIAMPLVFAASAAAGEGMDHILREYDGINCQDAVYTSSSSVKCALERPLVTLNPAQNSAESAPPVRTEQACHTIYKTYQAAALRCPINAFPIKVYDFWNGLFRGWSCDCRPSRLE